MPDQLYRLRGPQQSFEENDSLGLAVSDHCIMGTCVSVFAAWTFGKAVIHHNPLGPRLSCCGSQTRKSGLYATRFYLGMIEAGLFPGLGVQPVQLVSI